MVNAYTYFRYLKGNTWVISSLCSLASVTFVFYFVDFQLQNILDTFSPCVVSLV